MEFASLGLVLDHTADEAVQCLKVLKQNLAEYDLRHNHNFLNSAKSYMRSDMRHAKDISSGLKQVAQEITKGEKHSMMEVESARNAMNSTAKAMEILITRSRLYDETNGRASGVKGVIQNIVGGKSDTTENSDSLEALIESTLQSNFDCQVLLHQISSAENSLNPAVVKRASDAMHDVKDPLTTDKPGPVTEIPRIIHSAYP
ncbi:uncharacterized protein CCR75_004664 [Bremia lactucae]|uniref:Uncharacterized protein n=1 Tax=Bremia lactucae TaxID=4779 RepID=A0A976FQX2_BRELC|nr:hypothetical protein CCR75_004664 [Bremia lactucae]